MTSRVTATLALACATLTTTAFTSAHAQSNVTLYGIVDSGFVYQSDPVTGSGSKKSITGGGQSGSVIVLRGMTPGYVVRDGQAFSIIHGGRRYLHISRSYQLVNGAGVVILPMAPMLRVSPADGAIVEFFPKIEGLLEGDAQSWSLDVALNVGLSFTITEMR